MRRTYKIKFPDVNNELLHESVLYVLNSSDKKIMAFRKGDEDYFLFELLPEDETGELELMEEEDHDLLNVFINGKVVDNEGKRVDEGIPIYMTNDDGEMIAVAYTTSAGEFEFDHLHPNATYRFEVDEENKGVRLIIQDGDKTVELPMTEGSALYERVTQEEALNLYNEKGEPITIRPDDLFVIENIYFGFNQATLNVAAKYQLDQLAKIMLANPNITIELSSHTDSRGDDPYNLELSQQRANNSKTYLMEQGVEESRMVAKGFGETKLLNQCSNGVPCSEEDHALNRRTEIRIFIR
ncbi:MAG: OmpA family protein, partial [Flavobacteriales bacterium]|nr:OmpA family protein [Flavobacteriales bacterium]